MTAVLGIDLGGTRLRAACAPPDGPLEIEPLGEAAAPFSVDDLVRSVAAHAATVRERHGDVVRVGVTIPGLAGGTRARWVPNLPFLDGVDLSVALAVAGAEVVVANDAQLALLAEATLGAAAGARDAILLAVGTGIGSAVLAEGRIVRGAHGGACSFGWACADLADEGDPRSGWLERRASGRALDAAGAAMDPPLDGGGLIAAARRGDPAARKAIAGAADALGTALAGAVALLDPELVLVAGGVADALDVLEDHLAATLRRRLPAHLREVPVRAGAFGARAGIAGALLAARHGTTWWEVGR
ncbi:MAG TPA: ROK family protein [Capillimicrobium sp.]|nr:ROK family protein [Capillimicrobium sp.]